MEHKIIKIKLKEEWIMKIVLMSIQPKWVKKIISGEKTIEVRKTAPKEVPFKVYIYCTYGRGKGKSALYFDAYGNVSRKANGVKWINGKVIGEFVCDETDTYQYEDSRQLMLGTYHNKELLLYETCLTKQELDNYAKGKVVKLLHIASPRLYDKPKELGEFTAHKTVRKYTTKKAKEFSSDGINIEKLMHADRIEVTKITRPPQSWRYVETPDWAEEEI